MGVERAVFGCAAQGVVCSQRVVLERLGVSEILGNTEIDEIDEIILSAARDYADEIYKDLEAAYEYECSEENYKELAEINEWEFDEEGEMV